MTLLKTERFVICPKSGERVSVDKACAGNPRCEYYKHYAIQGDIYYVVCEFGVFKNYLETRE